MKRYWAFASLEYECGDGMMDFKGAFDTYSEAESRALTRLDAINSPEWGAVFDSKTGEQFNYRSSKKNESGFIIRGWDK